MDLAPHERLQLALHRLDPQQTFTLHECSESRPWSHAYRADRPPLPPLYLKGTPRTVPEALVTARLAQKSPAYVPRIVFDDILPETDWHWFATADAGDCRRLTLAPADACRAAYALGRLQREVADDQPLAALVPAYMPEQLERLTRQAFDAVSRARTSEVLASLPSLRARFVAASSSFAAVVQQLQTMASTCVHGDCWPGNIALMDDEVRFIDWGEAYWGSGGAAIWNLLLSSSATLAPATESIWNAYGAGWQQPTSQAYIAASRIAFAVVHLVLSQSANATGDTDTLGETLPVLEQIVGLLETFP